VTVIDWLVVLLIVVPAFPALTALILLRHWNQLHSPSLHERTLLAIRDWAVGSIAAALALSRLGFITLPREWSLPLLAIAMLLVSLPSAYWLALYYRGKFR
jgi:hypothetical protein